MSKILISEKYVIVELVVNIFEQNRRYIADCPALALSSHGKSISQAKKNFEEALSLWIEVTVNKKMLKKALLSLGWKFKKSYGGHFILKPEDVSFEKVPIELIAQKYYPLRIPYSAIS